jgi:hypothetical protein
MFERLSCLNPFARRREPKKPLVRSSLNLERLEDRTLPAVTLVDRNDPSISPDFSVPPIIGTVAALSPNGRYAVFYSSSPFIVPNAPSLGIGNGVDLFWRDLLTGETRLVSRSLIGTALNNMDPNDPVAISADGRYVAFYNSTNANFIDNPFNVGLDQNDTKDIFRWDRDSNGPVRLVSINKFGNAIGFVAEGLVRNLDMSSDGRYIGFLSRRDADVVINTKGLESNDNTFDIFRRDMLLNQTVVVSLTNNNKNVIGKFGDVRVVDNNFMSDDGQYFVFSTSVNASNINSIYSDLNDTEDVFIRDMVNQKTILVSATAANPNIAAGNTPGVNSQFGIIAKNNPAIVAFSSNALAGSASELVTGYLDGDANFATPDLYRRNWQTNQTQLVNVVQGSSTLSGNASILQQQYDISADGNRIAFASDSSNLVPGILDLNNAADVFLRDFSTGQTQVISVNTAGTATGNAQSTLGVAHAGLSPDGRFVAFVSFANNLVDGIIDRNGLRDAFFRDTVAQTTTVVSTVPNGKRTGNGDTRFVYIGGGASGVNPTVMFDNSSTNLAPDVFLEPGFHLYVNIPRQLPAQGVLGATASVDGVVNVFSFTNGQRKLEAQHIPFPDFFGEVRVAVSDRYPGNRYLVAMAGGPGAGPRVTVLNEDKSVRFDFFAFEETFFGGVNLALGDINGDRVPDIVVAADVGGGPRIRVFDGKTAAVLRDFFAFEESFRGGARVAVADVDGDGFGDLIVGAGFGGGPRVTVFSGVDNSIITDFFAFEDTIRNGVYVAAGDINGDGFADIITGAGPDGGPRVVAFDGFELINNNFVFLANFFAYDDTQRTGVRVAAKDVDGDGAAIVTGPGPDNTPLVRIYQPFQLLFDPNNGQTNNQFSITESIFAFPGAVVG